MKTIIRGIIVSAVFTLSACDDETFTDVEKSVESNNSGVVLKSRIAFDPSNGILSVPNDLLFSGTIDGTLNIPLDDPTNYADPQVALNALDGWSTINPFSIAVDLPVGVSLDVASVSNPASVKIFEVLMGGPTSAGACAQLPSGVACEVVAELNFQTDFISTAKGNNIVIVPTKPLKAKTTYIVVLTDQLFDSNGNSVEASSTYTLVKQDISEKPLGSASQLQLQGVINSFENVVGGSGVDKASIIYTMAMTTQSVDDVLTTAKKLLVAPIASGGTPEPIVVQDTTLSVAQALQLQGITLSAQLQALYSTANLYQGSVTLPYYLGIPSSDNLQAPVNDWWKALCDSGATLSAIDTSTLPAGPLSSADGACMTVGLRDLSTAVTLDSDRHLTKFNPIPRARAASDIPYINHPGVIDVQMTIPDISPTTDVVRASYGLPALSLAPDNGWPVVILQHGITSKKEDMLAITGILSAFGYATVAIDHPLHGSRGFDLDNDGTDDINASTVSATHYMNLASLLTTRDNLRQSSLDTLGLRLSLNAVVGADIDGTNVSFIGHSLGAISGINTLALANAELNAGVDASDALDTLFAIQSGSLAMPGVGVANFLMESPAFGNLIKANLTLNLSSDFQALLTSLYPQADYSEAELVGVYQQFLTALTEEQTASLQTNFASFTFAAQSIIDAGDPVNYAPMLANTETPLHLIEVVGDGGSNLSDQVIPNLVSTSPLAGTEAAISLLALPSVSETSVGSGAVRFLNGHHSSILSPSAQTSSPDAVLSARATQEMQSQAAVFVLSGGQQIKVTDSAVVQ